MNKREERHKTAREKERGRVVKISLEERKAV